MLVLSATPVDEHVKLSELGLTGAGFAASVVSGQGVGFCAHDRVAPASVMKIQIALAAECLIAAGRLDATEIRVLARERRTPDPTGVSLMRDDVSTSVRDLVVAMLTISDNAATDELIAIPEINRVADRLGLSNTQIASSLADQLDAIARDAGFSNYAALAAHDAQVRWPPDDPIGVAVADSAGLDPRRWTRTTAADMVRLLRMIWTDTAGPAPACAEIRDAMAHQVTRQRLASGFDATVKVAAKNAGLLDVVRNEAGVVTYPDGNVICGRCLHQKPTTRPSRCSHDGLRDRCHRPQPGRASAGPRPHRLGTRRGR